MDNNNEVVRPEGRIRVRTALVLFCIITMISVKSVDTDFIGPKLAAQWYEAMPGLDWIDCDMDINVIRGMLYEEDNRTMDALKYLKHKNEWALIVIRKDSPGFFGGPNVGFPFSGGIDLTFDQKMPFSEYVMQLNAISPNDLDESNIRTFTPSVAHQVEGRLRAVIDLCKIPNALDLGSHAWERASLLFNPKGKLVQFRMRERAPKNKENFSEEQILFSSANMEREFINQGYVAKGVFHYTVSTALFIDRTEYASAEDTMRGAVPAMKSVIREIFLPDPKEPPKGF